MRAAGTEAGNATNATERSGIASTVEAAESIAKSTRTGSATNVTFRGNSGEHTIVRIDASGPKWLCQPGHYMPSDPDQTIQGDFTDCEKFPCAPGYYGRRPGERARWSARAPPCPRPR